MRLVGPLVAALFALVGCSADPSGFHDSGMHSTDGSRDGDSAVSNTCTTAGQVVCMGNTAATCDGNGGYSDMSACGTQTCVAGRGCSVCSPGHRSCDASGVPQMCNADGTGLVPGAACGAGSTCTDGVCGNPCDMAATTHSYIGCDYWFTSTLNSQLGSFPTDDFDPTSAVGVAGFPFAVAVANPQTSPAMVTISGGGVSGMTAMVPAGQLSIIQLPWIQGVSQVNQANHAGAIGHSAFVENGAYHLASNVPVTVYDFDALSYRDTRAGHNDCDPTTDLTCFSFTNDASLLLPTTVLTGNYTVMSWPTEATQYQGSLQAGLSGFMAIIGTSSDPTTVTIHLSGSAAAGTGVTATAAGGTITHTLAQGDVLEITSGTVTSCTRSSQPIQTDALGTPIYGCQPDPQHDLTGSIVSADHPVAVFGGHDCANVPFDRAACDHLEEELFPNETLGQHYFISYTQPQLNPREPNLVRILSNRDGNTITFTPATVHAPVTLNRGQYVDFTHTADFEASAGAPFAVAQFFVGENYNGATAGSASDVGDPSMVLEVPVEQWRTSYEFLAPDTYTKSYVNVVAQHGASITLDGAALGASPATVGDYDVYRVDISSRTGAHHIESAGGQKFAIKVYGFGSYTSYMYPGGLDLTQISPPG